MSEGSVALAPEKLGRPTSYKYSSWQSVGQMGKCRSKMSDQVGRFFGHRHEAFTQSFTPFKKQRGYQRVGVPHLRGRGA